MGKYGLNGNDKYHQGEYHIKNPQKYIGDPTNILYRSSWEYKFMLYCDLNPGILKWGSEIIKISYIDRLGKGHNYIPDFYLETKERVNEGQMNKFLVEVKPEEETHQPIVPLNITTNKLKQLEYKMAMWMKNSYKWSYAVEWCKSRDIKFWLVTQEQLSKFKP